MTTSSRTTLWVAVGGVLAVLCLRGRTGPLFTAMMYLAMLFFGAPAYFVASFGPGMALADTFGVSGGDHALGARPLYAVSLLAFIGVVVLAVLLTRESARRSALPATA